MADFLPPIDPTDFFPWLKLASEQLWTTATIDPRIYGFQIQPGTCWCPGLTVDEVSCYETSLGFRFPEVYRRFLENMNGTAPAAVNIFGYCGHPHAYFPGYYSYPRDMKMVRAKIAWIYESFGITAAEVERRRYPHIVPLTEHRFLVADRCESNPVLSMYGNDVVQYARSLEAFLVNDIFYGGQSEPDMGTVSVTFWYDTSDVEGDGSAMWLEYLARRKEEDFGKPGPAREDDNK